MQTLTLSINGLTTVELTQKNGVNTATPTDMTLEEYQADGWQVVGSTRIDDRRIVELEKENG